MPKGKFEVQQKQLDELPQHRPLILYITAPVYPKDFTLNTSQNKAFKPDPALPNGVRRREGKSFNFCLVDADSRPEQLEAQVAGALLHHKDATHKVVIVNAHGDSEGVILRDDGSKVTLDGRRFGEMVCAHTHKHNLHVIIFAAYGHIFADQFYEYVQSVPDTKDVVAVTHFTSEASPTSWAMISTAGNGHVEVTRELGEFVKSNVEPNSPYKILDSKVKASCIIL